MCAVCARMGLGRGVGGRKERDKRAAKTRARHEAAPLSLSLSLLPPPHSPHAFLSLRRLVKTPNVLLVFFERGSECVPLPQTAVRSPPIRPRRAPALRGGGKAGGWPVRHDEPTPPAPQKTHAHAARGAQPPPVQRINGVVLSCRAACVCVSERGCEKKAPKNADPAPSCTAYAQSKCARLVGGTFGFLSPAPPAPD